MKTRRKMMGWLCLVVLTVCFGLVGTVSAIDVPDASFEDLAPDGGWSYVADVTTPWVDSGGGVTGSAWIGRNYVQGNGYPQVGHDLDSYVDINTQYLYQTLADTYVNGQTYKLTVWCATHLDATGQTITGYFTDGINFENPALALYDSGAQDVPTSTGTHTWYEYNFIYTATAADSGKNIGIMFWGTGDTNVDDISLVIEGGTPSLIYPLSSDSPTDWDLTLEWAAPSEFTPPYYHVYLDPNEINVSAATKGIEPDAGNLLFLNVQDADPNYPVTGLAHGVTYYWKVEARQNPVTTPPTDPNYVPSSVGKFTTLPDTPVITLDPVSQTVPATTDVTFTVEAINATDYQWYADGVLMTGKTDPSLTITGVGLGQEGYYYCNVANGATPAGINSDKALLMTERLFAQWTFENTIDAVVGGFTGAYNDPNDPSPDPAYDNSAPSPQGGYAIKFDGDTTESEGDNSGESVSASEPNVFNFYPQGVTASAWVKYNATSDGDWSCVVGKQHREDPTPWLGWGLIKSAGNVGMMTTRDSAGDIGGSTNLLDVNEDLGSTWHLVTGTYDGELTRVYVDGNLENTASSTSIMAVNDKPLIIGAERVDGLSPMNGLIDDVQIYTYALSRVAVAELYTDQVPGAEICTADPSPDDYDFNDDCIVNLKDFARIAATWLECYIVPTCIP